MSRCTSGVGAAGGRPAVRQLAFVLCKRVFSGTSSVTSTSRSMDVACKAQRRAAPAPRRDVVVGIDLGTTNSAVAVIQDGRPVCLPNADGDTVTPSVVTVLPDGDVVVGTKARRMAALHPTTTYSSVKRLIGRDYDDPMVQEEIPRLPFKVVRDASGAAALACPHVPPGLLYPEEVSAQVLAQLLADAEAATGGRVTKAVISVPAYFNARQREATEAAGKLAGLEVVRILREPVAAALAYGLDLSEDQTVLVFDLGGGTYDISLLEVGNGTVEVLSTGGDAHLGGDDWDNTLVQWLKRRYLGPSRLNLSDPMLLANLRGIAEAAKINLSTHEEVVLRMPVGGPGGGPLEVPLSRQAFDTLCEPLWQRCRLPLDQAAWQAGVDLMESVTKVDELKQKLRSRGVPGWKVDTVQPQIRPKRRQPLSRVLLVGGATRMPAVATLVANMTGLVPEPGVVDPDEAVALGAAVQAGILQGEVDGMMVMDQWQASLMRALAKMQLQQNSDAKAAVLKTYAMDEAAQELPGLVLVNDGAAEDEAAARAGSSEDGEGGEEQAASSGSDVDDDAGEEPSPAERHHREQQRVASSSRAGDGGSSADVARSTAAAAAADAETPKPPNRRQRRLLVEQQRQREKLERRQRRQQQQPQ